MLVGLSVIGIMAGFAFLAVQSRVGHAPVMTSNSDQVSARSSVALNSAPVAVDPETTVKRFLHVDVPRASSGSAHDLDALRAEYAALKAKQAGFEDWARVQVKAVSEARNVGKGIDDNAKRLRGEYLAAMREIEGVLDRHPSVIALRGQQADLQKTKLDVSAQTAKVIGEWEAAKKEQEDTIEKSLGSIQEAGEKRRVELMAKFGKKDILKLTAPESAEIADVEAQVRRDLLAAHKVNNEAMDKLALEQENGESRKRLDALNVQYKSIGDEEKALDTRILETRNALRRSDPSISAMQRRMVEKSGRYVSAVSSSPGIAEAQANVENLEAIRAALDARLILLESDIRAAEGGAISGHATTGTVSNGSGLDV
jgi:hypothetical protein